MTRTQITRAGMGMGGREGGTDGLEGLESGEIVMGLRLRCTGMQAGTVDLSAACLLLDRQGRVLEKIHAGHTRTACGSVVHTGSAVAASGNWDHERVFVFLDALPAEVAALSFVVESPSGRGTGQGAGVSCHISDRNSEQVILYRELAALRDSMQVAVLTRRRSGWSFMERRSKARLAEVTEEELQLPPSRAEARRLSASG